MADLKINLVSVIVVARDEEKNIERCLAGVKEQETDFPVETIVVDSGSCDRTADRAGDAGARVIEIRGRDFQHGRTRQMASLTAKGDYLVYLVADACPANQHWLQSLVGAVANDGRVAGAYSRQIPRDNAGPIEAYRLEHRASSRNRRQVREITKGLDFFALSPEERLRFCEFDDVSCCRRASLLNEFPIPEVDWAEDLFWAKDVLLAGHRIVFEPESIVRHSHAETISHSLRRGYLDQLVAMKTSGVLYFDNAGSLLIGYPKLLIEQTKAIREKGAGAGSIAWNAARLLAEIMGNFMASRKPRQEHVAYNLSEVMAGKVFKRGVTTGKVMKTRFALDADNRKVLFMNPDAAAAIEVRIPEGSKLLFSVAINPAARPMRKDPVLFVVAIDNEPVWSKKISMGKTDDKPCWTEGEVDLARWAGKRARITLLTRADNTDYAWAGWGEPRIVVDGLSVLDRAMNNLLEAAERMVRGEPLRHP